MRAAKPAPLFPEGTTTMILVLSGEGDVHADAVEAQLRRLGAPAVRFDPARYPAEADLSVRIGPGGRVGGLLRDGRNEIKLEDVHAVWARRPGRPRADARLPPAVGAFVETEAAGFLADLWDLLDVPFVPATPAGLERAGYKMRQLRLAGGLGFEIPGTLVTNDPDALLDHYTDSSGRMITKRVVPSQRLVTVEGNEAARRTIAVRPRDLVDVDSVRWAPIMAQPVVDKRVELRVTVVGGEVFSAAIDSQETHHTRVDFRRYDEAHTRITPYPLPAAERDLCVALTRALGLCYSTIDLILTPEGRTVFLEINPNGQYLWIEYAAGLPISRAIATLLAEASLS